MKPKSKGAGIMLSDFIDDKSIFLALTETEHEEAKISQPSIKICAREFLEYGANKEGYWTRDKFIAQMEKAIHLAEIRYPISEGWHHAWIFDHSSCHGAMADDALDVNKMNVRPGGKQRLMDDTLWNGMSQSMTFMEDGQKVAKGMEMVLQGRGISTHGKNKEWMQKELSEHSDFKHEKSMIETLLVQRGHTPLFLPKFHPELNPIERVWAQLKRYTKAHCK